MDAPAIHLGALIKQFESLTQEAFQVAERAERAVGEIIGLAPEVNQKPLPGATVQPVGPSVGHQLNELGHRLENAVGVISREIRRLEMATQSEGPAPSMPERVRAIR